VNHAPADDPARSVGRRTISREGDFSSSPWIMLSLPALCLLIGGLALKKIIPLSSRAFDSLNYACRFIAAEQVF
jgi:hypothetical protein